MLYIANGSTEPFYNQAFEEYVFNTFREDEVFLLWRNSPAVVVGCYQNICREVDVLALRRLGIPVIRRMSGGGTVYHDLGNLNYTLIRSQEGPVDYERYLEPMIRALNELGVPAHRSRTCDLAIGEKKISGSAQRAASGRVLHHGTLLFETDLSILDQITTGHKNDCITTKGTVSAICTVANIRDGLDAPISIESFAERLLDQVLPAGSTRISLTAEQNAEAERLRDEKYRGWGWTWGKTPAFTYERHGIFLDRPIRTAYGAKGGVLHDAVIESPWIDGAEAARLLNGARLDPDGLLEFCRSLAGEHAEKLLKWLL